MSLYLIRHGETDANAARVLQTPEAPLSKRGVEQARRLAQRLSDEGIGHILASDLARAAMTAQAVQSETGAELSYEPLLQERNFGDLRGTPYSELGFDPFLRSYSPPGGESWEVFHERVARAWECVEAVAHSTDGHLAVVTHGFVCHSLVARHLELPSGGSLSPFHWANTSVTIAEGPDPWRIRLLNCAAHLEDQAPAGGGPA